MGPPIRMLASALAIALTTLPTTSPAAAGDQTTAAPAKPASATVTREQALREGWALRDARNFSEALIRVQAGLAVAPNDSDLYRLRTLLLTDLGASYRAWQLYQARPELFDQEQREMIQANYLARKITWSRLYPETEPGRLDEALAAEKAIAQFRASTPDMTPKTQLQVRHDELILLNQLERHEDVVRNYEQLEREGTPPPAYALAAVGDSMLSLRRPEKAEPVLERAVSELPNEIDPHILLGYAQMEQEHFGQAIPGMDAYAESQAAWATADTGNYSRPNWARYYADTNRASMRSFGEDHANAQHMLESLASVGPYNSGLQTTLGSLYYRRGWYERALERFRGAKTVDEREVGARVGEVETLLQLDRGDEARPVREELLAHYSRQLHVQQMNERWHRYYGWQWRAWITGGFNDAVDDNREVLSPFGDRDREYGVEAATPLFDDRWRLTAAHRGRWADFGPQRFTDRRNAIGVSYAYDRLAWSAEVNRSSDGADRTGAQAEASWRFNDIWRGYAGLRLNDYQVPLRAYDAGIEADSLVIGADYRPSELTSVNGALQHWRFDDGNNRFAALASVDQRLWSRPHFLVNGIITGYTSSNSRDDTPYFNPSRDASVEFAVRLDHLAWRDYDTHFRHRLTLGAGPYWQEDYGTAWVPAVSYQHEWQFDIGKVLTYGVNWSRPVYDGQREERLGFEAEFRWGTW